MKTRDKLPLSSKFQVVIPKNARKIMGIDDKFKGGFKVKSVTKNQITLEKIPDWRSYIGSMDGVFGNNPTKTIREHRDSDWN